ncbi:MAG: class I SAM-dependent methyltransferase [Gemmatimonadota bacterium]|nr:class I SAM-dependent methyltransferase [Gemmatimonadota bacterium]
MDPAGLVPLGQALRAYHEGERDAILDFRWDPGQLASVPVAAYFTSPEDGPGVEVAALDRVRGHVVDVGGGSGRFGLALQARGYTATGLDVLPDAVAVMQARGLEAILADVGQDDPGVRGDTVLVMMNGTTLAGSLAGLAPFLQDLSGLMAPRGRILIDSTDPAHPAVDWLPPGDGRASGELHVQLGFRKHWGPPLPQLFLGPEALAAEAARVGLMARLVTMDPDGRYLAELTRG